MKAKNQSNSKSRSRNTVEIIDEEIDPKVARIIIAKEWDGNDKDVINVYATGGSNGNKPTKLIAIIYENGIVEHITR